jgi:hypothetical protein
LLDIDNNKLVANMAIETPGLRIAGGDVAAKLKELSERIAALERGGRG